MGFPSCEHTVPMCADSSESSKDQIVKSRITIEGRGMQRIFRSVCVAGLLMAGLAGTASAQKVLTWDEVKTRFESDNPSLQAGRLGIEESKAQETTANLRPNPNLTLAFDQWNPFPGGPPHSPGGLLLTTAAATYLHERRHKRELRLESAKGATEIAVDQQADLDRTLLFT